MRAIKIATAFALTLSSIPASAGYGKGPDNTRLHRGKEGAALGGGITRIDHASLLVCTNSGIPCVIAVTGTIEVTTDGPWSICVVVDERYAVPACTSEPFSAGNPTTGAIVSMASVTRTPFHKAHVEVRLTSAGTLGGWGIIYQTYQ